MVLINPIVVNTTITQATLSSYSWPLTVSGSAYITFGSPLVFTDVSYYFIIGTSGVIIDGCGNKVDISGVVNYPGLVQNGTNSTYGNSNTTIKNMGVRSIGSTTLANYQGWIGQQYYSNNASGNIIQNCYSTGNISNSSCGGIVGQYAGQLSGGNLSISGCYTTGAISGNSAGGIFGLNAGYNYGKANSANCYTTGVISGTSAGGVFGGGAGYTYGTATSTNCYTTGAISGDLAGGIFGTAAGYTNGTATSTNCYTTGAITGGSAGGIFGLNPGLSNGNVFATNCYVVGSSNNTSLDACGNYTPGIFGSNPGKYDQSNCFVENGIYIWISTNASSTLNGQGTIWKTTGLPTDLFGQTGRYTLNSVPETYVNTNNTTIIQNQTFPLSFPDASYGWPLTIVNSSSTNPITIKYSSPVVYTDVSHYLIVGSPYITIDGCGNTVDVSGVVNYPGLVQNGTSGTYGKSNTTIKNLGVRSIGSTTLASNQGWIGQQYYSSNASGNIIQTCYSTGVIGNSYCGGIVGQYAGNGGGNLSITNCYTTGDISGNGAGGIIGSTAAQTSGTVSAIDCSASGVISGTSAGGIFGQFAANLSGSTAIAIRCNTTGTISGQYSGGIFASTCGINYGTATSINCSTRGAISGNYSGGIFGKYAGTINGIATSTNCSTTGAITGNYSGGIFGEGAGYYYGTADASSCSTTGAISGNYSGGIFGYTAGITNGTATSNNCYTTGAISGTSAGGIFGYAAGLTNGTATSTNCYTTGAISGNYSGGIFGEGAGRDNGRATSTKCYTTGEISGLTAGGIFGSSAGWDGGGGGYGTVSANNCFVVGGINTRNNVCGGIFGNAPVYNALANNCFVVSGLTMKDTSNNFVPGIFASSPGRPDQSNCIVTSYWNSSDASNTLNYGISPSTWSPQTDPLGQPTFYKLTSNPDTIPRKIAYLNSTTTLDNSIPDGSFSWPLTLAGGSQATPMILTLGTDLVFPDANHYFIIGSNYITIDGSGRIIDISGVPNYPGIVQNPVATVYYNIGAKAFSNTTVQNIRATTKGGSFLPSSGGWIGQAYYGVSGQMNTVQHCSSTGVIGLDASSISCGGIVGQHSGGYGGQLVVFDCSSSGNITGTGSGGIAGQNSGRDGGRIDVSQCFSTGNITGLNGPGGIFGAAVAQTNGTVNATNCYSTGRIAGLNAGGIFGRGAGTTSGNAKATNCYALGQIDASGGGGIFGSFAGNASTITALTKGNASAVNCYYDGSINNVYAGGIFGSYPSGNSVNDGSLGRVDVSSCYISLHYNVGTSANNYIYGTIVANDVSHVYITNTGYSTGEWNNGSANQYLYKVATTGNGNIWNANFIPYHLTAFDPLLGTINIITGNNVVFDQNAIDNTYSWPVTVQTSTATPTTIVFNGSVQLTPASTKYFVVNGQTVSLVSNSGTAASLTNTDTTANSLFRGK
jgi:hypothetical protein